MDVSAHLFEESQSQLDHGRLMALINSLQDGVLAVGPDGKVVLSNSAALAILDVNVATGRILSEVLPLTSSGGDAVDLMKSLPNPAAPYSTDQLTLNKDGQATQLNLTVSPVRQTGSQSGSGGWVIVIRTPAQTVANPV